MDIKKTFADLKSGLNGLITKDSSKEQTDKIGGFGDLLKAIETDYEQKVKDYDELKDDYIKAIKNTKFVLKENPRDDLGEETETTFESILADVIAADKDKEKNK